MSNDVVGEAENDGDQVEEDGEDEGRGDDNDDDSDKLARSLGCELMDALVFVVVDVVECCSGFCAFVVVVDVEDAVMMRVLEWS